MSGTTHVDGPDIAAVSLAATHFHVRAGRIRRAAPRDIDCFVGSTRHARVQTPADARTLICKIEGRQ
jgi:hypothetical protein